MAGGSVKSVMDFIEIYIGLWFEMATGLPWSSKRTKSKRTDWSKKRLFKKRNGYYIVFNNGKWVCWHRLVWEYFNKCKIPDGWEIDHINGKRDDNRLCNLRLVDRQQNTMNRKKPITNTSGVTGVYWHNLNKKWCAQITFNGKRIYLGSFDHLEDAIAARKAAEIKYFGKYRRAIL